MSIYADMSPFSRVRSWWTRTLATLRQKPPDTAVAKGRTVPEALPPRRESRAPAGPAGEEEWHSPLKGPTGRRFRVMLDVNVLVSGALSTQYFRRQKYGPGSDGGFEWSTDAAAAALILRRASYMQPVVTPELLAEWEAVRTYPQFKDQLKGPASAGAWVDVVLEQALLVELLTAVQPCRLLAGALAGEVDFLVTDDLDLLVLGRCGSTLIVSPLEFVQRYRDIL